MRTQALNFNKLVQTIYDLPLEDRVEIISLLEHNIAEARRNEIAQNFKKSQAEHKSGKLEFSSNIEDLKTML